MSFYVYVLTDEGHSVVHEYSTACESRAIIFVNSLTMCVVTDEFKRTKLFT